MLLKFYFYNFKITKKRAFSLVELLISLITISCIAAALAPIFTKKAHSSMTLTQSKSGQSVWVTPGIYSFSVPENITKLYIQGAAGGSRAGKITKKFEITSSKTITIPKGVHEVTFTITGSGGGGVGGKASVNSVSCTTLNGHAMTHIEALADNGKDMCITYPIDVPDNHYWGNGTTVKKGENCMSDYCCWIDSSITDSELYSGIPRTVCTYKSAHAYCSAYENSVGKIHATIAYDNGLDFAMRLITQSELERIIESKLIGNSSGKLHHCGSTAYEAAGIEMSDLTICETWGKSTYGSSNNAGYPNCLWLSDYTSTFVTNGYVAYPDRREDDKFAAAVFCAYEIDRLLQYSGAGGSSGAILTKTIDVLPGDTLTITIGSGGAKGNNGSSGSQGETTKIVRTGSANATYYVKGGLGGTKATTSGNGSNTYTSTPSDTCYDNGSNVSCTYDSILGSDGTSILGGAGGAIYGEDQIENGGSIDGTSAGQDGETYGFGGGGGSCTRGSTTCSQGGNGAAGLVKISYDINIPGAGGGAGARVGLDSNSSETYEIIYKTTPKTQIQFVVGQGGAGGSGDGEDGSATIFGDNEIVFLAGKGAKAITDTQSQNLLSAISDITSADDINTYLRNTSYLPEKGNGCYIDEEGKEDTSYGTDSS